MANVLKRWLGRVNCCQPIAPWLMRQQQQQTPYHQHQQRQLPHPATRAAKVRRKAWTFASCPVCRQVCRKSIALVLHQPQQGAPVRGSGLGACWAPSQSCCPGPPARLPSTAAAGGPSRPAGNTSLPPSASSTTAAVFASQSSCLSPGYQGGLLHPAAPPISGKSATPAARPAQVG